MRTRLSLSFLAILILFGASQGATFWGNRLRARSMTSLDHALSRQVIIASLRRELDNLHKEVTLLGQIEFPSGEGKVDDEARRLFDERVAQRLEPDGGADAASPTSPTRRSSRISPSTFEQLAQAWRDFYAQPRRAPGAGDGVAGARRSADPPRAARSRAAAPGRGEHSWRRARATRISASPAGPARST